MLKLIKLLVPTSGGSKRDSKLDTNSEKHAVKALLESNTVLRGKLPKKKKSSK